MLSFNKIKENPLEQKDIKFLPTLSEPNLTEKVLKLNISGTTDQILTIL